MAAGERVENSRCKVSIIILHYNGKEHLKRLLPSIANQTFGDYEVIIIDDFSLDRSILEYIKTAIKDYEKMRLIENRENLGFVKTCNKGIRLSKGEYICLLNQDIEVKSNFIERNVQILDADGSIGALSCIIVDQDGDNWFTGGRFKGGLLVNLKDDFQGIRTVDFVAGTAPFYRKDVFNRIGLFNEDYRMYHEDIEFGLRLRTETDYRACVFSEKLVAHYLEPSIPMRELHYLGCRNHILILKKYYPKYLPIYLPKVLLWYMPKIARFFISTIVFVGLTLKPTPELLLSFKWRPQQFLFALRSIQGLFVGLLKRQSK